MGRFFDCANSVQDPTRPHHLGKRVFVDAAGRIASEEDDFYSGKSFFYPPKEIQLEERLVLTYDYSKTNSHWSAWAQLGPNSIMEAKTIGEADRLLSQWGLSRHNSN